MPRGYGELQRLGTRYKREKKGDLFTHGAGGRAGASVDEGSDEALALFRMGIEGEREAGAEQVLDGFRAEQTLEGLGLAGMRREGIPDEQGVAVTTVLECADVGFGGLETCGSGNLPPGPMQNLALPDDLKRAANPVWIVLRAGPAFLAVLFEVLRAVVDGAAQGCQFFGIGGLYKPVEDCFQKDRAVAITIEKAEVQKSGVAGIFLDCR